MRWSCVGGAERWSCVGGAVLWSCGGCGSAVVMYGGEDHMISV